MLPGSKDPLVLLAPAKVNLHLGIHPGRDGRGYHRADSIMIALDFGDQVIVRSSHATEASFDPPLSIPTEKSTVYCAAAAFKREIAPDACFSVDVTRCMPGSAGLGSSSADAGTALRGMARLAGTPVDDLRLISIARSVGADVAFFLEAHPALYAGAGDVLVRSFAPVCMPVVVVKPEVGVSTVEAYRAYDANPVEPAPFEGMVSALEAGDPAAVAARLCNNLAPAAIALVPEVGECAAWLAKQPGVLGAQVTGSGSASFAICESDGAAARIAASSPWWARAARTVSI